MKRRSAYLLLLILLSFVAKAKDIHFQSLGSIQGMSQSSAISIWQDNLGRMWFGNDALNCYDGETVRVFRLSDYLEGVEDANLHTITGNDSLLFVVAENQLISFDLKKETFRHTGIYTTSVYKEGYFLYYFSSGEFFRYDIEKRMSEKIVDLPGDITGVRMIIRCSENSLLLASPVGCFLVDQEKSEVIERIMPEEDVLKLMKDSHENIWITTRSRKIYLLFGIHANKWNIQPLKIEDKGVAQSDIYCLTEDVNGSVWLGTLTGIYQVELNVEEDELKTLNHVMPESTVFSVYSDRQGTLWIGSYYGDVRYFNPEVDNYVYYPTDEDHPDRLHGAVIGDIAEDKQGNLYIITEGSGVNIYHPETGKSDHLTMKDGLRHHKIRCLWYDEQYDRVFFGEYMRGISYYDVKNKQIKTVDHGALSSLYKRIIENIIPYRGYLIIHTQDGLFRLNRHTLMITPLFVNPELNAACAGIVRTIHIDERDVLWVSSFERGLFTVDMKTGKILSSYGDGLQKNSVIPSAILRFAENPQKGLYLMTLKSGILSYNPQDDSFRQITDDQQLLLSNIGYNMIFSNYGNLIVTTNKGISILNISSRKHISVVHHFRLASSFPLQALSGDCGLFASQRDDRIYVGGLYGMLSFAERDLRVGRDNYSLYFSSLQVNNHPVIPSSGGILDNSLPYTRKVELSNNQNTLNLSFAATNYLSTRTSWYEYKVDGLEDLWTLTNHKNIIFNSLRPGRYKILLREVGNESKMTELALHIKPPFWATLPAILFYVLLGIFLLYMIIRFNKSKALLKVSLEMERQEVQRIEEVNRHKMDFFINISNEFRTPLTLIVSQLERLVQELPAKGRKRLDKVRVQATRLQDLITELLDFRKMENNNLLLHVANYNLNDFLKKIYGTYVDVAEERQIRYRYKQLTDSVDIWFDKKQMQKVVYNLLSFVFRYAQPKEGIELTVHMRNKWAEIQLVYDGVFPQQDTVEYLFMLINGQIAVNPDLSMLPEGGMGIAFSKGIVGLHQGRISVATEGGKTYFLICLPLGNSHFSIREMESVPEQIEVDVWNEISFEDVVEEEAEERAEEEEKGMRLLIVEVEEEIRSLLKDSFSFLYEVVEYTNASEAYEYAMKECPDLIITEVNTQGMNGIEFCHALKSNINTLHVPVVVVSSQPSEKQKVECIRNGADAYIVKPFNLEFLLLRCNSLVKYRKKILRNRMNIASTSEEVEMTTNERDRSFMETADLVIENHIGNPDFDTTLWSRELGISRTRLFSQIKKITGMTPNDYILHIKMNKGAELLKENTLTIAEIAYMLGFSIPSYFSKCFKKQFGITPAEYRKK